MITPSSVIRFRFIYTASYESFAFNMDPFTDTISAGLRQTSVNFSLETWGIFRRL